MADGGRTAKVVSANRLDTGAVVWLGRDGSWVGPVAAAAVVEGAEAESALARAKESERCHVVVDAFLVDVVIEDGVPRPVRPRERIRSRGPSVRPDLGYQASAT